MAPATEARKAGAPGTRRQPQVLSVAGLSGNRLKVAGGATLALVGLAVVGLVGGLPGFEGAREVAASAVAQGPVDGTAVGGAAPSGTGGAVSNEHASPATGPRDSTAIAPSLDPLREATAAAEAGDLERARTLLEQVVAGDPRSSEALTNLGLVLMRLGRADEATSPLSRAAEVDPTRPAFRFNLALALGAAGNWQASVEAYREAARLAPADYPTRFNLAQALHELGREQDALAEYEIARDLNDADAPLHLALGLTYERVGQPSNAVEAYRRYLELEPGAADGAAVQARVERLSGQTSSTSVAGAG